MVMLGGLKGKLEDMPMPMEGEEAGMEGMEEGMADEAAPKVDLSTVSDEELKAELAKRGL
jgi:hypothetical protein